MHSFELFKWFANAEQVSIFALLLIFFSFFPIFPTCPRDHVAKRWVGSSEWNPPLLFVKSSILLVEYGRSKFYMFLFLSFFYPMQKSTFEVSKIRLLKNPIFQPTE